jgi:hypothetical protein
MTELETALKNSENIDNEEKEKQMGRKKNEDQEVRPPKPKEQFRITLSIYDDGYIDRELREFYTNENTGKRKMETHTPKSIKKAIEDNLAGNTDKLASWILDAMGIEPNAFARRVAGRETSFEEEEMEDVLETIEEMEDAEEGEDLP